MSTTMELVLPLPAGYDVGPVLAFHSRDVEAVSEQVSEQVSGQVSEQRLRKAVLLDGVPLLLDIALTPSHAHCQIVADAAITPAAATMAQDALHNVLGLRIDPAPFLAVARADPLLAPLARRHSALRVVQSASVFEALTWAIIGQQIHLGFAIALRRSLIVQAGVRHSNRLWCYPEAREVACIDIDALLRQKFSRAKADTLLRLARLVDDGTLSLDRNADLASTSAALLAIKGIGPWTVNYALLRGFGYADCSLHGDVAIRTALQRLLAEDSKPDLARTEALLARWAPHRTMAAALLWASLAPAA
ncbi:DNA-3-methyladenine glycosylase 2 [Massilia sp. PWRC2]|uniref:DNA-3-methyladenine glycosylase 2 n=1 Tax=Massilia sp. PWRC2 TaxID=2804626 RepID=UPI003CE7C69C